MSLTAQNSKSIRKLKSQRTELRKKINDSERLLKSTKKDVKSQLNNLLVLDTQIGEQKKYVDGMQVEIDTLTNNINVLQKELAVLQTDLAECKRKYSRSVMYMFRNRMVQNKLMFIFSAKNFRQMYRRLRYMMEYAKYQRAEGEIIKRKEIAVNNKKAQLLGVKVEKDRLLADGKKEHQKLESQKNERQGIVNELQKKQSQLQATINQSRRRYNSLNARIDQLIKQEIAAAERRRKQEEARRKALAEKARREREARERQARREAERRKTASAKRSSRSSKSSRRNTEVRNSSREEERQELAFREADNEDRKLNSSFAANRGRLPVPITGSYVISSHYGSYNVAGLSGVKLDNKGINLTGHRGAQARCVFNGEVSSIFSFGGMVNIIVRHGSYMSVYCNLSSSAVRRGQKVSTRQILGTVATDASGNSTLHFQLRKETTKLNPESWIGR